MKKCKESTNEGMANDKQWCCTNNKIKTKDWELGHGSEGWDWDGREAGLA